MKTTVAAASLAFPIALLISCSGVLNPFEPREVPAPEGVDTGVNVAGFDAGHPDAGADGGTEPDAGTMPLPEITSFTADPSVIENGGSSVLTAVFSGGDGVVDNRIGAIKSGTGVTTGSLTATSEFMLTVTNPDGISVMKKTTVSVIQKGLFNWVDKTVLPNWGPIASSSDGMKLAAAHGGYLYTSTDGGETWIERTAAGNIGGPSIATSSDGMRLAAVGAGSGYIYTSADGGETWVERTMRGDFITSSSDSSFAISMLKS